MPDFQTALQMMERNDMGYLFLLLLVLSLIHI